MATSSFAAGGCTERLAHQVAGASAGMPDFSSLIGKALEATADAGRKGDIQTASVAAGRSDIVDVVTAVAESEAAIETLVAVRDRVIAAYEEIMRMPV